ncbi:MAG TPA: outer membrane beta-barrel protein [Thermoanaerobaculia bacterium]|jgi:hypothetical protein
MKIRVSALLFCAILASAGVATAQVRQGTVEISPFAGYLFGGTFARGSNALFTSAVDVDDHATYGGRLGVNLSSLFELEFQYSRTDTSFVTRDTGGVFDGGRQDLGDLNIDYYMGYLTFNFGHRRVVPYFTMGAGAAHLDPRVPGVSASADTRFTASLGGGLKVFVTPHFGLRFDGRGYTTSLGKGRHISCNDFFDTCSDRHWLTNGEATGGLIFAF